VLSVSDTPTPKPVNENVGKLRLPLFQRLQEVISRVQENVQAFQRPFDTLDALDRAISVISVHDAKLHELVKVHAQSSLGSPSDLVTVGATNRRYHVRVQSSGPTSVGRAEKRRTATGGAEGGARAGTSPPSGET
jgi:hypothetical protein